LSRNVNGWLSPFGELFECKTKQHTTLADLLAKKFYPKEFRGDGEPILEEHNWIKIYQLNPIYEDGCDYDDACVCIPKEFARVTISQKDKLKAIYEDLSPMQRQYADMFIGD
jgi:hypothetical protein